MIIFSYLKLGEHLLFFLLNHYFNSMYFLLYMRHFCIFHILLTIGHHGNLRKRNKETRERPPCYLTLLAFVWWLFLKSWNMWNTYLAKSLYVLSLPIRNWISHLFLFWEYITFFFKQICENQKIEGSEICAENLSWGFGRDSTVDSQ